MPEQDPERSFTEYMRTAIGPERADAGAAEAALGVVRVSVAAETARAYTEICSANVQIAVAAQTIELQSRTLELTERLLGAGSGTGLDVARARSAVASSQAALPPLRAQKDAAVFRLATLTGVTPREVSQAVIDCAAQPRLSQPIPVGDGASLLTRRPDVRQAERNLAAASARVDVATASLYPSIQLGGSVGATALDLGELGDDGALRAFDAETGATRWSWAEDGPGYTSPIIVTIDGVKQLITQSQRFSLGFDPDTGKVLWQVPYATAWDQNSITPIAYGNLIVFSGIDMGITALRIIRVSKMGAAHSDAAPGDNWRTEQAWHNADLSMYMSSPVLDGHLLYGLSHKKMGQYFCLDTRSGETLWTSPGRQGENASLIDIGNQLLLFNTEAQLVIVDKDNTEFAVRHRYTVAQNSTWAHPAALDTRLLVKDATHLYLWSTE